MSDFLEDSKVFVNEVIKYESIDSSLQQCAFHATVRASISSKEDVRAWVDEFSEKTGLQAGLFWKHFHHCNGEIWAIILTFETDNLLV